MPEAFGLKGGTSMLPYSFAVKCCTCARAVVAVIATVTLLGHFGMIDFASLVILHEHDYLRIF